MFEKLDELNRRYEDISRELQEPSVLSDSARYASLMKEQNKLLPIVDAYGRYMKCKKDIAWMAAISIYT